MKRTRGRIVDIETLDELDRRLAAGASSLQGWRLRRLDLTGHAEALGRCRLRGATFLGCTFATGDAERVEAHGGLVLPELTEAPVDVYRADLYTPEELYDDPDYRRSLDARAYAWSQRPPSSEEALAEALHDHAIDSALAAWTRPRHLVGVMGGHAAERGQPAYADAARLGRDLAQHAVVATGGGPGAMEAANLGAFAPDAASLDTALERLAAVPSFRPDLDAWAGSALEVRRDLAAGTSPGPAAGCSLGLPTWFYGHEPPNVFCHGIGKYFSNAIREDGLLSRATAGLVVLEGAAGTVQEVFQALTPLYYAAVPQHPQTLTAPQSEQTLPSPGLPPVVLVGREHWTRHVPIWPAVQALGRGRPLGAALHLVDSTAQAAAIVAAHAGHPPKETHP